MPELAGCPLVVTQTEVSGFDFVPESKCKTKRGIAVIGSYITIIPNTDFQSGGYTGGSGGYTGGSGGDIQIGAGSVSVWDSNTISF